MAEETTSGTARSQEGRSAAERTAARHGEVQVDWLAAERSPEFKELIKKRRAFVLPATIFFLAWYFGFILLAGYAPDFMGASLIGGLTVGYALALTQFVMVWVLGFWYLRKADREFDPLSERAAERAIEVGVRGRESQTAGTRDEEVAG